MNGVDARGWMAWAGRAAACLGAMAYIVLEPLHAACAEPATVSCDGVYGGHLQGVAFDDAGAIYWSFTVDLVKTDASGKVLRHVAVPDHHGDLCWKDGEVHVAVNLGRFNQETGADSWVYVYDAADLSLRARHPVPEAVHGAGGMDWAGDRFFVVGGLPADHTRNYVYEYDMAYRFIARHEIASGQTRLGIQTACHADGVWWFGCYGTPPVLLKTDDRFALLSKHEEDFAIGIARAPDGRFWRGVSLRGEARGQWRGRIEAAQPGATAPVDQSPDVSSD